MFNIFRKRNSGVENAEEKKLKKLNELKTFHDELHNGLKPYYNNFIIFDNKIVIFSSVHLREDTMQLTLDYVPKEMFDDGNGKLCKAIDITSMTYEKAKQIIINGRAEFIKLKEDLKSFGISLVREKTIKEIVILDVSKQVQTKGITFTQKFSTDIKSSVEYVDDTLYINLK